jgi:hypothetical protein
MVFSCSIYMSGTPRSGARQELATEVTEITEGGLALFFFGFIRDDPRPSASSAFY